MPRITISIPTDLRDRLADPAVKKALNISRVCQEALARQVQRLLELPMDVQRMERMLARLRKERDTARDRWYLEGSSACRDWVEHEASLEELRQLGESKPVDRLRRLRTRPPQALARQLQHGREQEGFSQDSVLEAWSQTIGLMWEAIKSNL
jgi:hypothetical protein